MRQRLMTSLTCVAAVLLAVIHGVAHATPLPANLTEGKLVLSVGHTDMMNVTLNSSGNLVLDLKEDVTGSHVRHRPEDVVIHVKQDAWRTGLPASVPGSPEAYVLPMTQDHDLVWPGWDTLGIQGTGIQEVRFEVTDVVGPGTIHVFSQGNFGGVKPVMADGGTDLPGTIVSSFPAHTHANWVVTKPGVYTFKARASAVHDGTTKTSNHVTYTWIVGDLPQPSPSPTATPTATDTPSAPASSPSAPVTQPTSSQPATSEPTPSESAPEQQPTSRAPVEPSEEPSIQTSAQPSATTRPTITAECRPTKVTSTKQVQVATSGSSVADSGHFDMGARLEGGRLIGSVKDDRKQPASWVAPESLVFHLGDRAKMGAPTGLDFVAAAGSPIWIIGATQTDGVPWLGQNTMHPSIVNETTGTLTWHLDAVSGPGKLAVFNSSTFGGGVGQRVMDNVGGPRSYTVPANTHAHPNWVFTQPGTYRVKVTQTGTLTNGKKVSATNTLTFAVGVKPQVGGPRPEKRTVTEVVGRTPDGKPCELKGLPQTGSRPQSGTTAMTTAAESTPAGLAVLFGAVITVAVVERLRRRAP